MEIHHHSSNQADRHQSAVRKKWSHYIWEFLMLFLAVFCGFLAENFREHKVEHKREVEYIRSMIEDLKEDTASFRLLMRFNLTSSKKIDTLIALLKGTERSANAKKIYFLGRTIPLTDIDLVLHNKTFEQLKSSGGLRLIRHQLLLSKIGAYYQINKFLETGYNPMQFQNRRDLILVLEELFDASIMQEIMKSPGQMITSIPDDQFKLLSDDPKVINRFCTRYHIIYTTKKLASSLAEDLLVKASELIESLQKEYHLK